MVVDVCTFNGEKELFDIRYNVLKYFVDEFRVIEFDKTFSSKPKKPTFKQYYPKVRHYIHNEDLWNKYHDLAISSPNTEYGKGAGHWITEFCQKESIKDALTDLKDTDLVFIGDVDEIYNPDYVYVGFPKKLKLQVYSYYLNNRSSEEFWGTTVAYYSDVKENCLNHLRQNAPRTEDYFGWHFTSMGGYEKVKQKLLDSYTEETYATPGVLNNLKDNINGTRDFLGRQFSYIRDDTQWPKYLKDHKAKYSHLLLK